MSFTVDTVAPQTTFGATPPALSNSASASFTLSADDPAATFECRLDGAAWAACVSPHPIGALADGDHTFAARARDAAGNVDASPATHSWRVDTVAPETVLVSGPPAESSAGPVEIAFSSPEAGAGFECALDGAAFAVCTSPATLSGLAPGDHTLQVRARDGAGNVDATPVSASWRTSEAAAVPVLAPWALAAMAGLLGAVAGGWLRRRS